MVSSKEASSTCQAKLSVFILIAIAILALTMYMF